MKSLTDVLKAEKKLTKTEVIEQAKKQSATAESFWSELYRIADRDTAWIDGDQWPEGVLTDRVRLTLNKLRQFVNRVVGDQRQNVHTIQVVPTSADTMSDNKVTSAYNQTKRYTYSETMEGLIRHIEYESKAQYHYKKAFKSAVEGGVGWLRVYPTYAREDTFDMDIRIESISNRSSVLVDPKSTAPDMSDINYAFIFSKMDKDAFRKKYPNADLTGMGMDETGLWEDDDKVTVTEYFTRVPYKDKILLLSTGEVVKLSAIQDVIDDLMAKGVTVTDEREVILYQVKWYLLSPNQILDETIFPGQTIPVIPVLGREIIRDKKRKWRSLVYDALDAQKMHNVWSSVASEKLSLAPLAPYTGAAEVFKGFENLWKNANVKNYAYLPYDGNAAQKYGPPQRMQMGATPMGEMQLASISIDEIKSSIGMYDASLGNRSNETSGKAILARQRQSDTGTFEFLDNLDMAITRVGRILIDLIPVIYDTQRLIRILFPDGSGDFVEINKTIIDEATGEEVKINDLSAGKYDVVVETGASYNTQREESSDKLMNLLKIVPQVGQVAPDLIVSELDIPHATQLAKRLKRIVPPDVLSPEDYSEEEQQNQASQQQAQAQQAQAAQAAQEQQMQLEQAKQQLEMQKEQLKVQAQELELEQKKVELEKAKAEAQLSIEKQQIENQNKFDTANQNSYNLEEVIREEVAKALAEFIQQTQGGKNE